MRVLHSRAELRAYRDSLTGSVALVPTMGALHDGHRALIQQAHQLADHVLVSIFVNPIQFDKPDDLEHYPRTLEQDLADCRELGVDAVFVPPNHEMYRSESVTRVIVSKVTDGLCGAARPGHFEGVATVVAKLFHLFRPDYGLFGTKDLQQLVVIQKMVHDLDFDVKVVGVETVREEDGLALSSRNQRLNTEERKQARSLSRGLSAAWAAFHNGERDPSALEEIATRELTAAGLAPVYVCCVSPLDLGAITSLMEEDSEAVLALSADVGPVRLIDNLRLDRPLPPPLEVP